MKVRLAATGLLFALLAACGGNGDNNAVTPEVAPEIAPTPAAVSAEGRWVKMRGSDATFLVNVLENGEIWAFYASKNGGAGNLYGNLTVEGTSLKGSLTDLHMIRNTPEHHEFTGNVTPKAELTLNLPQETTLSLQYDARYEQAANAAALAGAYVGHAFHARGAGRTTDTNNWDMRTGSTMHSTMTASDSGEIMITLGAKCSLTGTAHPRASGKDIFDANLTFHGEQCLEDEGTLVRGIATQINGVVLVQTLDEQKRTAFTFFGSK